MIPQSRETFGETKDAARCPCCGRVSDEQGEAVVKRGAIIISSDPPLVTWRGKPVPLSPAQAHLYAFVARRGRCTYDELDAAIEDFGGKRANRSLMLGHIRSKFSRLGACDPFERIGPSTVRLRVDPDRSGSVATVIGLRLPRYVVAAP
jgi:hypothetical protein